MIKAKNVLIDVRYKNSDSDEVKFSDYDIKNAVNEAIRYISQNQALQNDDYFETSKEYFEDVLNEQIDVHNSEVATQPGHKGSDFLEYYNFKKKGVELPDDFQILVGVSRGDGYKLRPCNPMKIPDVHEYKVMGNKVFCGCAYFNLFYQRSVLPVKDLESDLIDLPNFCYDLLVKVTNLILNQAETDVMLKEIDNLVKSIVPRRKYNNARIKMPFVC